MSRQTDVKPGAYICFECGMSVTSNRVTRMRAGSVIGHEAESKRIGRPIVSGDMCFCGECHQALFGSYAMQRRYPELFVGGGK